MDESRDLLNLENKDSLMGFLKEPTLRFAEILTGVLVSDEKHWKLSAGKIVQAAIKGTLLTQLGREIEEYQKIGRVREDYLATHKSKATLYELLKFLDEEVPDDELFAALKSIFFSGITPEAGDEEMMLAYEFLQTGKKITGTEVLILKAIFALVKKQFSPQINKDILGKAQINRSAWKVLVATQMGYRDLYSIVIKYESNLESLGLISPRAVDTRFPDEFENTQNYRLTNMGIKFCEYITNFPPTIQ